MMLETRLKMFNNQIGCIYFSNDIYKQWEKMQSFSVLRALHLQTTSAWFCPFHQLVQTLMYSSQTDIWICSGCKIPKETEFPTEFSLQPNAKCSGFGLEEGMREGRVGFRKPDWWTLNYSSTNQGTKCLFHCLMWGFMSPFPEPRGETQHN